MDSRRAASFWTSSNAGPRATSGLEARTDPDPQALRELGERLESHIRFEERELFPMIEQALPDHELARLGAAVAHTEGSSG